METKELAFKDFLVLEKAGYGDNMQALFDDIIELIEKLHYGIFKLSRVNRVLNLEHVLTSESESVLNMANHLYNSEFSENVYEVLIKQLTSNPLIYDCLMVETDEEVEQLLLVNSTQERASFLLNLKKKVYKLYKKVCHINLALAEVYIDLKKSAETLSKTNVPYTFDELMKDYSGSLLYAMVLDNDDLQTSACETKQSLAKLSKHCKALLVTGYNYKF